ncbi:CgeB family protein [Desulfopila inferna]|uniref:CgeB family protein n=1 Tax=Desulfopila inferna TaxID=468528 RepID=UPI00196523E8|nr:glycosyltransferase [Desulfopila inferna]MBM9606073.1 glycosyltransferase [Desulfopila inferna]
MNFSLFYQLLESHSNHGNAHFLQGVVSELQELGHRVRVFEPDHGWNRKSLLKEHGTDALEQFREKDQNQVRVVYNRQTLDLEKVAAESDVIIVQSNEPWLVNGFGVLHNRLMRGAGPKNSFKLLFHDSHHRSVSDPAWLNRFRLDFYDGILVFGKMLRNVYRKHGWSKYVWIWHEAADIRRFFPRYPSTEYPFGDLVWIGNWGDVERTGELNQFLFHPVQALGLKCHIYGRHYPREILGLLKRQNIEYCGRLPNFHIPKVFANHAVSIQVPRRIYAGTWSGIPAIRPFEALACGIPLITSPWQDNEGLFESGKDFLVARDGDEMRQHLRTILNDPGFALQLAAHGLATIREHHTCSHRVTQLLQIVAAQDISGSDLQESALCTDTLTTAE